jgi:hypothetical protein
VKPIHLIVYHPKDLDLFAYDPLVEALVKALPGTLPCEVVAGFATATVNDQETRAWKEYEYDAALREYARNPTPGSHAGRIRERRKKGAKPRASSGPPFSRGGRLAESFASALSAALASYKAA